MMDWSCCNPVGRCERSVGCPAGPACHHQPDCTDLNCPGRPMSHKGFVVLDGSERGAGRTRTRVCTDRHGNTYYRRAVGARVHRALQVAGLVATVALVALIYRGV